MNNWGQNGANYVLTQLLPIAIVAIIVLLVLFLAQRKMSKIIATVFGGALVVGLIVAPETLEQIGRNLISVLFG